MIDSFDSSVKHWTVQGNAILFKAVGSSTRLTECDQLQVIFLFQSHHRRQGKRRRLAIGRTAGAESSTRNGFITQWAGRWAEILRNCCFAIVGFRITGHSGRYSWKALIPIYTFIQKHFVFEDSNSIDKRERRRTKIKRRHPAIRDTFEVAE